MSYVTKRHLGADQNNVRNTSQLCQLCITQIEKDSINYRSWIVIVNPRLRRDRYERANAD